MKPIIFIPGIEATALVNANTFNFDLVWNAYDTLGTSLRTKVTGPYIEEKLMKSGRYDENINALVERNHIARLPYEKTFYNLGVKLRENDDDSPVYLFGYDWRLSNKVNADRLASFAEGLKGKISESGTEFEGFKFVTHSMGGLVLSCYLNDKKNLEDVDRVLFCAPPFLGSPYALVHMVKGDGGFKSFLNSIFGRDEDIRKIVRTYPSLFELLPWYKDSLLFDDNKPVDLLQLSHWQSNIYDDILDLFKERLKALKTFRDKDLCDLSQLPGELRTRMLILAGSDDTTVTGLLVRKDGGKVDNLVVIDDDDLVTKGSGDGTVPYASSSYYKDSIKTLEVAKRSVFHEIANNVDYHGMFLRDSRVQKILFGFLVDERAAARTLKGNSLAPLKGPKANWWQSISDSVKNISPF